MANHTQVSSVKIPEQRGKKKGPTLGTIGNGNIESGRGSLGNVQEDISRVEASSDGVTWVDERRLSHTVISWAR